MAPPPKARSQQKRSTNESTALRSEKPPTVKTGRGSSKIKVTGAPSAVSLPPLPQRTNPLRRSVETATKQQRQPNPTVTARLTSTKISSRGITLVGISFLAFSTYCGYLWAAYRRDVAKSQSLQVSNDVSYRFNEIAREYDSDVELGERLMRLGARRKELVRMARGDVLEVSCGTGRNMTYYRLGERMGVNEKTGHGEIQGCRSVTFVDLSPKMVEIARRKFEKLFMGNGFSRVAFRAMSAKELTPPFEFESSGLSVSRTPALEGTIEAVGSSSKTQGAIKSIANAESSTTPIATWSTSRPYYFDTILQTMGLCSTPDPVGMLRHLGTITEPENGQILLLEHGRSYYGWLNTVLDNLAAAHASRYGCWWNRDIGQIVEQSGLEVVDIQRYHLGTTWRVILRPKQGKKLE